MNCLSENWRGELWSLAHENEDTLVPPRDEFPGSETEPAMLFATERDALMAANYHREEFGIECHPVKLRDGLS